MRLCPSAFGSLYGPDISFTSFCAPKHCFQLRFSYPCRPRSCLSQLYHTLHHHSHPSESRNRELRASGTRLCCPILQDTCRKSQSVSATSNSKYPEFQCLHEARWPLGRGHRKSFACLQPQGKLTFHTSQSRHHHQIA